MASQVSGNSARPPDDVDLVPDISVVLVCWNNKAYLEPCLHSLYGGNLRSSFDVVVVDNGSTDGSQQLLAARFPAARVIQNERNVGLGRASNQGIEATCGRYVLLLNNDTLVNGASLDAMVQFLDAHPEAAAVGGKLLNPDGSVQACYNRFPSLVDEFLVATRLGALLREGYPAIVDGDEVREVDWLGSACLMLRRAALERVGLLDESYFIYGDEVDLQYRLGRSGWRVYFLPHATTVHYGGRSLDRWRRRTMVYRGKMLFFQKNYGAACGWLLRALLFALSAGKVVVWIAASPVPGWRERATRELASNLDVMRLCLRLA